MRFDNIPDIKRKSQINFVTGIVMIIAVLIFVLLFWGKLGAEIKSETPKNICKLSVQENALLKFGGMDFSDTINCPTQSIKIAESLADDQSQKKAKRIIADSMADCWEQFGEGKYNLFEGDGIFCVACSIISFENPEKSLNRFTDYFFTEKILQGDGKGKIYSEYISGVVKGQTFQNQETISIDENLDVMDTSQDYVVMFYYPRGERYIDTFYKKLETGSVGYAIGGGTMGAGITLLVAGGALTATVIGAPVGIVMIVAGKILVLVGAVESIVTVIASALTTAPEIDWAAFVQLKPYQHDEAFAVCDYLPVNQGDWWTET